MSDIFREVDEDIRQEKYRRLWDRFGPWVIGAAVLIVVATAGYRGWVYYQDTQAQAAGDKFIQAIDLAEDGDFAGADAIFAELETAHGGYPALATLRRATTLSAEGKTEEAIKAFDAIATDTGVDEDLREIAALRAAFLAVDTESYVSIADRVEPLAGDTDPFRASAREIMALAAWKAGEVEAARGWITALDEDQETPGDVAARIDILERVIVSQFGTSDETGEGASQ